MIRYSFQKHILMMMLSCASCLAAPDSQGEAVTQAKAEIVSVDASLVGAATRSACSALWMKVNIFSFSMQFLLTPLLLRSVRTRWIQAGIPLVHICTCAFMLARPGIFSAGLAFLLFKGMDYSIFRASKETLYIPFSYDTRYRAKQVADAFSYRFSKGATSLALAFVTAAGAASAALYAGAGLLFSGIWGALTLPLTAGADKDGSDRDDAAGRSGRPDPKDIPVRKDQ